ncbi:MAG: MBL fold metallo-hydrolase [Anaerolineae bacterium]|nr:MBL fold metallo-hydrolase [Anaerolineae bacterium]
MREIAEDVYVADEYYGANVGCVLTYEGSVLVDAPIVPSEAESWAEQLREVGGTDIRYLFLTDNHPNHAIGSARFDAPSIANERAFRGLDRFTPTMRERVLDAFRDWAPHVVEELADFEVVPPEITFDQDLTLYKGGRTLRMLRLGGHSPPSSAMLVEDAGVLFAGDVVVNEMPPFIGQGNSSDWLSALKAIRGLAPRLIVPGHGPVGGMELVDRQEDFLLRLREGVSELLAEGRSRAETATRMLHLLDEFEVDERWRKRTERAFRTSVGRVYEELRRRRMPEDEQEE